MRREPWLGASGRWPGKEGWRIGGAAAGQVFASCHGSWTEAESGQLPWGSHSAPIRSLHMQQRGAERALDALSFFVSDARYGLGAYLGVYLLAEHGWDPASIGAALSIGAP